MMVVGIMVMVVSRKGRESESMRGADGRGEEKEQSRGKEWKSSTKLHDASENREKEK